MSNLQRRTACVVVTKDNKICLSQRKGERTYKDKWQCPGGKVDKGEDILNAAVRELYEESGIAISPTRLTHIEDFTVNGKENIPTYTVSLYYVELGAGENVFNTEPDKQSDWQYFDVQELHQMHLRGELIPALDVLVNYLCL